MDRVVAWLGMKPGRWLLFRIIGFIIRLESGRGIQILRFTVGGVGCFRLRGGLVTAREVKSARIFLCLGGGGVLRLVG